MERPRTIPRHCTIIVVLAVLVPAFASLWLIYRFGRDVPYWDEWDAFVPQIHAARQGTLRLLDLLEPHNEHRITFPRLITIANAYVTTCNRKAEMYANLFLFMAATGVAYLVFRNCLPGPAPRSRIVAADGTSYCRSVGPAGVKAIDIK